MESISKDDPLIHACSTMRNIRGPIESLERHSKRTCHFANTRGGTIAKESAVTSVGMRSTRTKEIFATFG